jgi:hypothetical protein
MNGIEEAGRDKYKIQDPTLSLDHFRLPPFNT